MAGLGDDIVGQWSQEAGFHSAMDDEQWYFLPDRTGSVEYARHRIVQETRPLFDTPMPVLYLPASFATYPDKGHGLLDRTPDTSRWLV